VKAPVNGHVVNEPPAQYSGKASPNAREAKPAASLNKPKQNETKSPQKKETKQDLKAEKKEKLKRQEQTEEVQSKQKLVSKKETEDEGEWTTVQLPKKNKKQKPAPNKVKDGSLPESAVESEPESEVSPSVEAAAAAAAVEVTVEDGQSGTPQPAKAVKKKVKKDKIEKTKGEEKEDTLIAQETEKVVVEDKKKKKKEKKTAVANDGGAAAGAAAALPQEAAPASAKSVDATSDPDLPSMNEEIKEEFQPVKTSPKKKKAKARENVREEKVEKIPELPPKQEKKIEEPVKKSSEKKKPEAKGAKKEPPVSPDLTPTQISAEEPKQLPASATTEKISTSPVSFDEIGDSWQEAAPKSKKKKPRRDN
ncbi:hypothetical protein PoB_002062400, partial [Plakobranchus ocellatus]